MKSEYMAFPNFAVTVPDPFAICQISDYSSRIKQKRNVFKMRAASSVRNKKRHFKKKLSKGRRRRNCSSFYYFIRDELYPAAKRHSINWDYSNAQPPPKKFRVQFTFTFF